MASAEKMREKLLALEAKLELYGYVPSQKEDRAVYANAKYYYTNYPNNPIVARLMERFPIECQRKRTVMSRADSIDYVCERISELKYIPGPTEDRALYSKVKYLYEHYPNDTKVSSLMRAYPLIRKKSPSMFAGMTFDEKVDVLEEHLIKHQRISILFDDVAPNILRYYKKYPKHPRIKKLMMLYPNYEIFDELIKQYDNIVEYFYTCIQQYNSLPGDKSIPFVELSKLCYKCNYQLISENGEPIHCTKLVVDLINKGFSSQTLNHIYNKIMTINNI